MNPRSKTAAVVLAGLLSLALAACVEPTRPAQPDGETAVAGDVDRGEELVPKKCSQCHTLDRVQAANKSQAEWDGTVERMIGNGLEVTTQEKADIVAYLAARDESR